jgi:hypothetical protein
MRASSVADRFQSMAEVMEALAQIRARPSRGPLCGAGGEPFSGLRISTVRQESEPVDCQSYSPCQSFNRISGVTTRLESGPSLHTT